MSLNESIPSLHKRVRALERSLERETRINRALRDVGKAIGSTLEIEPLLELILGKITEALEADRATLYLLDDSKRELVSHIVQGGEVRAIRLRIGQGIAGYVARTGRAIHVRDPYRDQRFSAEWDILSGYKTCGILAAPMTNHAGETIGVVQVLNKRKGAFSKIDAQLLAALATQAAVSIENSRLFTAVSQKNNQLLATQQELERRAAHLKLLFELEHAMGRTASIEELVMAVSSETMRACRASLSAIALREGELDQIVLYLMDEERKKPLLFPLREGEGLIGYAMRCGEEVMTEDVQGDTRNNARLEQAVGWVCHNALIIPLEGETSDCIGALALYNKHGEAFSEEDRTLLQWIAANVSTAVRLQFVRQSRAKEERLTTVGRLLSGVVHDLKTPLAVISGYVQMMQETSDAKKRNRYGSFIVKQFEHIAAMQREVLEFVRGERSILIRKVYLQKFFEEIKEALEKEMQRYSVELQIDLRSRGVAYFDEGKIRRVIHNLARNAAEAMGAAGGVFKIKVQLAVGALEMEFSDTGPGIPQEIKTRLFQSFISAKQGGTGLGLAITKKIVDEHRGDIAVHSSPRGATFAIRIPQSATNA